MEEKMRREKQKGKSNTDELEKNESTSEQIDDDHNSSTDDEIIPITALSSPQEPTIDDDGQSHNIDNAVQYENEPQYTANNENPNTSENYSLSSTLSIPTSKYTTTTNSNAAVQHHRQRSSNGDSDKIEFEKIEVVEIKSDGTTGHLIPRQYDYHN